MDGSTQENNAAKLEELDILVTLLVLTSSTEQHAEMCAYLDTLMESGDHSDERMERFRKVREQLEALRPEEVPRRRRRRHSDRVRTQSHGNPSPASGTVEAQAERAGRDANLGGAIRPAGDGTASLQSALGGPENRRQG